MAVRFGFVITSRVVTTACSIDLLENLSFVTSEPSWLASFT